jgi:hypothetical protein
MPFGFTQRNDVEKQVRKIATAQTDKALEESRFYSDFDETVHGLRRRCKKLRGLLRLIEPRFKGFEAENRAVRDAADGLAGMRDAAVMIETFEGLLKFDRAGNRIPRLGMPLAEAVNGLLVGQVAKVPEGSARQQLLADFRGIMEQVGNRAKHWSIGRSGFASLAGGLEETYRRMADGMGRAMVEDTAEAMHDWRKQTKYHWHHVSLLSRTAPELLAGPKDLLDKLGELLGGHHNLHVLDERLAAEQGLDGDNAGSIRVVIVERQAALAERAFAIGRQLTAEKPAALRRRFEHYWQLLPDKA